jgi:hypothetical protein
VEQATVKADEGWSSSLKVPFVLACHATEYTFKSAKNCVFYDAQHKVHIKKTHAQVSISILSIFTHTSSQTKSLTAISD